MGEIPRGFEYVKSPSGLFKMAEMFTLMIAAGTVGRFMTVHPSLDYENKIKIFLAFVVIAILVAVVSYLIFFAVNSTPVNQTFGPTRKASIVFAITGSLLLVGSALLANFTSKQSGFGCAFLSITAANCGHLIAGTVFGFFSFFMFAIDSLYHLKLSSTEPPPTN